MSNKLFDLSSCNFLIGYLFNNTDLYFDDKFPLDKEDFRNDKQDRGSQFIRILYATGYNLALNGAKTINEISVGEFVKGYREQMSILEESDYISFIQTIKELSNAEDFSVYYNRVRKMSLLAEYDSLGWDIKKFFDVDKDEVSERGRLEQYSIDEIIEYFNEKQFDTEKKYSTVKDDTTRKKAGENGKEILEEFETNPTMGLSFESKYLTTLWNGFEKKQLYIRSGDTSSGKSRSCIGDMACVSVSEIYDIKTNQWIRNPNGTNKALYIGCEMELDKEVDPILWAYVSGVSSSKITKGKLTKEEKERVNKAIDIIYNDNNLYLTDMPSFNIQKLEEEIKTHKRKYDIDFVIFDYILINSALVKEFVQNRGSSIGTRGDEILLELSKSLKDLAKKYDVGILTATQVNADIKDYRNRDYQVLRGGKAIADKATGGSISMPITSQELKLIEPYLEKRGFNNLKPNFVETVYKARFSEYPKECKIFSYFDLGNMRKQELFVTDKDFKPINIEKTIVNRI